MASHLDLEEQEQLAELKHFWNKYGNLISGIALLVFGSLAAWNGWNWWHNRQALQASALYSEVERAAQSRDLARVERSFNDMREQFASTTYAQQSALVAAQALAEGGKADAAQAALTWVVDKAGDEGLQAVARLRLAGLLADAKNYDAALKQLDAKIPAAFEGLAADRRGDLYQLQGKKAEAKAQYLKALSGLEDRAEYRRLVEVKLAALGGDPSAAAATAASAK